MSVDPKFKVQFYDEDVEKEYKKLDGYIKKKVDIGLRKLEPRADELGKVLVGDLFGCKELKYRKDGIRVIFRIQLGRIEIVDIIAIGDREEDEVFQTAIKRLKKNS